MVVPEVICNRPIYLAIAAGTHSELERQRLKAGISADAIMRLNFGWFMLDASGGSLI
tara:strand:+ start:3129 stop:3299 length:171 start_codon:yes stop_codon:yes gene_type:complete